MKKISSVNTLGLFAALIMTVSNMMGSGIYMMPASLAKIGSISILGWPIVIVGILSFSFIIAKLASKYPQANGIVYYAYSGFGEHIASICSYIYSIANWIALVSLLTVTTGYAANFYPILNNAHASMLLQIMTIWILTLVCIRGSKTIGLVQSVAFLLAVIPILVIIVVGWHWFNAGTFLQGWRVQEVSSWRAITLSFNIILWSFIGVESTCIAASIIHNPTKTIPRATIIGVLIAAGIYLAACTICMGVVESRQLALSNSPFADVLSMILHSPYGAKIISLSAILGSIGATVGWMLITAETLSGAAAIKLFPKYLAVTNNKNIPHRALIFLALIYTIIVLFTSSPSAQEQFNQTIGISVVLYLIPYIYSAAAGIILIQSPNRPLKIMYNVISIIGILFFCVSLYYANSTYVMEAVIVMFVCIIPYALTKHPERDRLKGE